MKKIIPVFVALLILVGAGSFYGGMKYSQSKNPFSNLQGAIQEQRGKLFQQAGGAGGTGFRDGGGANKNGGGGNRIGSNFATGDIISKDSQSVTLKLQDGGSKIVFFSPSTTIMKTSAGTPDDLGTGISITANGSSNADGSLTAQSIQIRPAQAMLKPQ